jgi:hypothetical protein
MRQTNPARPVPTSFGARERLPAVTPVVGDRIEYRDGDDVITADQAMALLRAGKPVQYVTFEDASI